MRDELYSICWNITSKCNEDCKFCYRKVVQDNSLEENKLIFDKLSKIKIGKISFCGGEPLLYEDLFELVNYIRSINPDIKLSITTNGKIIDEELFEKIIRTFDWITFSIDTLDPKINEEIGRGSNHLNNIIKLLNLCDGLIKVKINTVAMKSNINELPIIYEVISKYNISRWKVMRFYPLRRGKKNEELFSLDEEYSEYIQNVINELNNKSPFAIHYNDFNEFSYSYFNIYPDGSIENSDDLDIGNLNNMSLSEILYLKNKDLQQHSLRRKYE